MAKLDVGVQVSATNDTEAGLAAAKESVKSFQEATGEAGKEFVDHAEAMSREAIVVGESCSIAEHKIMENARSVREASRDYKLMNIEQMQYNQILQMTAQTAVQWGSTLQGQHNLVRASITSFVEAMDRATGGFSTYVGAAIQAIGMAINMYSQYQRLVLIWGMHAAAVGASTAAQAINTTTTEAAIPVQWSFNAALAANPAGAVALAIIAISAAVAIAINSMQNYKNDQAAVQEAIQKSINKLDEMRTKFRETILGIGEPKDLLSQKTELEGQITTLEEKAAAADQLGMMERAQGYRDQVFALNEDLAELNKRIETQQANYIPSSGLLFKQAEEIRKAAEEAYKSANPINWWTHPDEKSRIERGMKTAGQGAVEAFLTGMLTESMSPGTRRTLEIIASYYGLTLQSHSPPAVGPLHEIDIWGANLMKSFSGGMLAEMPAVERDLDRGLELRLVPELNRSAPAARGGENAHTDARRSTSVTNNFYISGVDEESIARAVMRRISSQVG